MEITVDTESSPRIVTILAPTTSVTIQELVDAMRDWENQPLNMSFKHLINAEGKLALRAGKTQEITLILLNVKIAFEARPGPTFTECEINAGSLVAFNDVGAAISPIETTAYVQVNYAEAVSGAAVTAEGVWAEELEGTFTAKQMMQLMAAALAAKSSGGGTGTVTFRDLQDTLDRLAADIDGSGNRTAVTRNV